MTLVLCGGFFYLKKNQILNNKHNYNIFNFKEIFKPNVTDKNNCLDAAA